MAPSSCQGLRNLLLVVGMMSPRDPSGALEWAGGQVDWYLKHNTPHYIFTIIFHYLSATGLCQGLRNLLLVVGMMSLWDPSGALEQAGGMSGLIFSTTNLLHSICCCFWFHARPNVVFFFLMFTLIRYGCIVAASTRRPVRPQAPVELTNNVSQLNLFFIIPSTPELVGPTRKQSSLYVGTHFRKLIQLFIPFFLIIN